jgi:hypothetical protein
MQTIPYPEGDTAQDESRGGCQDLAFSDQIRLKIKKKTDTGQEIDYTDGVGPPGDSPKEAQKEQRNKGNRFFLNSQTVGNQ